MYVRSSYAKVHQGFLQCAFYQKEPSQEDLFVPIKAHVNIPIVVGSWAPCKNTHWRWSIQPMPQIRLQNNCGSQFGDLIVRLGICGLEYDSRRKKNKYLYLIRSGISMTQIQFRLECIQKTKGQRNGEIFYEYTNFGSNTKDWPILWKKAEWDPTTHHEYTGKITNTKGTTQKWCHKATFLLAFHNIFLSQYFAILLQRNCYRVYSCKNLI